MTPILPGNIAPLKAPNRTSWDSAFEEVKYALSEGLVSQEKAYELLESLPSETLRELVRKVAGTDASFLTTFTKQVRLVDAVLNQLVHTDGRIKESAADAGISLKDALTMSTRISGMLLKDLPKLYTIDRIQRMERAFGDVVEELPQSLQAKLLDRLAELTKDK